MNITARRFKMLLALVVVLLVASTGARAQETNLIERVERAASLIREKRLEEAERELSAVLKVEPNQAGALNLLGTIRAMQRRLDEAEMFFSRAASSDKQFVGPHINLAYLYLLKGAPEKAEAELKEVLRLDPENTDAAHRLARLLLAQNRVHECVEFIEGLRQRRTLTATLLALLGDAYQTKGDAVRAEESYLAALASDEKNGEALLGLAQVSQRKPDASAASAYLARASSSVANSPDLLYRYALIALKSALYEDAMAALRRADALRPDDAAIVFAIGVVWLKKPDLVEAERAFRQSLKLRPGNAEGELFLGYALLKQKRYEEARALLESSVKTDATRPEGFYYLGLLAQEQREDARAVEVLEDVARRFPAYAHAHVALGVSYLRLKDYTRARRELELAVKLRPDDQKAHYNLALLYARLNEPQRAQEEMRIVESLKSKSGAQTEGDDISTPSTTSPPI